MKPLVIIGSGGQAREIAWLIEDNNIDKPEWEILGYVSKDIDSEQQRYPVLGNDDWFWKHLDLVYAVCAVGDPKLRKKITNKLKQNTNIVFPPLISRHAIVSSSSIIGEGSIVCAGSIITTDVSVGKFVICNPGCTISHDAKVADYVTINAGTRVSGNVTIQEGAYLGVNSCTIQGIQIGRKSIIGAGAAVIRDIPDCCTAVGVPARIIKQNEESMADDK